MRYRAVASSCLPLVVVALNAQTAAIISYLDPVVAVLISVFILREGMDIVGVVGAVLILGAALCSELEKKK